VHRVSAGAATQGGCTWGAHLRRAEAVVLLAVDALAHVHNFGAPFAAVLLAVVAGDAACCRVWVGVGVLGWRQSAGGTCTAH